MTDEEKRGIVHEVVEEIKRQSQDVSELPVSNNIEDFTSLPVVDREGRMKRFAVSKLRTALDSGSTPEVTDVKAEVANMKTQVDTLNEGMTGAAQTIQEMQQVIGTHDTSLNDLTTRVGSMETNSTRTAAVMAAVKVSVEGVKASSTTTDGKTLEDVYTLAKEAANREPAPRVEVVQATGDAEDKVMSQKAVTEALKGVGGTSAKAEVMKLRQLNENFFIRTAPNVIKTKLIPIPEGTKSLDFDITKLRELYPGFFTVELHLYDSNVNSIPNIPFDQEKGPFDISDYPDVKYYTFVFRTEYSGKIFLVNEDVLLPITDSDFVRLGVPVHLRSLPQHERSRIMWIEKAGSTYGRNVCLHIGSVYGDIGKLKIASDIAMDEPSINSILNLGGACTEGRKLIYTYKEVSKVIETCSVPIYSAMDVFSRQSFSAHNVVSNDCFHRLFIKPLIKRGFLHKDYNNEVRSYYVTDRSYGPEVVVLNPYDNDDLKESEYWEPVEYNESYPQGEDSHTYTYDENTPVFVNFFPYTKYSFRLKKSVSTGYSESSWRETMPTLKMDGHTYFSQEQLTWLCEILKYMRGGFMIAGGIPLCLDMTVEKTKLSNPDKDFTTVESTFPTTLETDVIKEILKAYTNRGELDLKVRYKEDGPAAYLNVLTDEEGHKYAFNLKASFQNANGVFKGFLGGPISDNGMVLKEKECGFYSIHAPIVQPLHTDIEDDERAYQNTYAFNIVGIDRNDNDAPIRIARIGYDMNDDGSVDDVLELKKD